MRLLIFESTGDWAAALRREFSVGVAIVQLRSLEDLWNELMHDPQAVVVMEVAADRMEPWAGAIEKVARYYPDTVMVAVGDRGLRECETVLREAGAAHVVFSPRSVAEIAAIARRRLAADGSNDFNAQRRTLVEQLIERFT
jgi:hypothetical protein